MLALSVAAPLLLADLLLATPLLPRPPLLHEAAQLCRRAAQPARVLPRRVDPRRARMPRLRSQRPSQLLSRLRRQLPPGPTHPGPTGPILPARRRIRRYLVAHVLSQVGEHQLNGDGAPSDGDGAAPTATARQGTYARCGGRDHAAGRRLDRGRSARPVTLPGWRERTATRVCQRRWRTVRRRWRCSNGDGEREGGRSGRCQCLGPRSGKWGWERGSLV